MSDGVPYADLVIMALFAIFILLRLRSVLGQKTGNDNPGFFTRESPADTQEPVVQISEKLLKSKIKEEPEDPYATELAAGGVADGIALIKTKDPQFNATLFLDGAKIAFEMVFEAFGKGDKPVLNMLLSEPLYAHFSQEIDAREAQDHKMEHTLVAIPEKDITDIRLNKNTARIAVRYTSEQISVTRDAGGAIIEGNPSRVDKVIDEWTFERDITSKNPNWKIIET